MAIGMDSFTALFLRPATGVIPDATDRLANLLEKVEVASTS